MTTLRLHNTLTRGKEDFVPLDAAHVRVYACGPTVYDRIHVGRLLFPEVTFSEKTHAGNDKCPYEKIWFINGS